MAASATLMRGVGAVTTTETAADVVESPRLSVATAVSEYVPATTPVHVKVNGLVVELPICAPFARNATLATDPSVSAAVAAMEIDAGSVKLVPAAGAVVCVVLIVVRVLFPADKNEGRAPMIAAVLTAGIAALYFVMRPAHIADEDEEEPGVEPEAGYERQAP